MIEQVLVGAQPVWMRAVMVKEGDDVVTRCCVVTEGQFFPIEVRVNVPGLIKTLGGLGMLPAPGQDGVAGIGSFLKKAAKAVTKNKLTKAVGGIVKKVVKNPVAQVAVAAVNPGILLGMHNASVFTGGKGILPKPIAAVVNTASRSALGTVLPVIGPKSLDAVQRLGKQVRDGKNPLSALPSIGLGALDFVAPQASAALGIGLKTVMTAKAGSAIANVAKAAQAQVNAGKAAAQAVAAKKVPVAKVAPILKNAVATRAMVTKLAPQLAKKVVESSKVKKQLAAVQTAAKAGSKDAQQTASIVARAAKAINTVQNLQVNASGGIPGLLVTAQGKIVKAPRGRFLQRSGTVTRPDILYRGPKEPVMKGLFAAVSGCVGSDSLDVIDTEGFDFTDGYASVDGYEPHMSPGWGGDDDPGNDIDGPRTPVHYEDGELFYDRGEESAGPGAWTP